MTDCDLRTISLGAGVQSTALYLMAVDGILGPKPDVAIFADTQQEPPWVYENLDKLRAEGDNSIPIEVTTVGDIADAALKGTGLPGRYASVPFWTKGERGSAVPGWRQCTRDYKIDAVKQAIRRMLGLKKGQHATKFKVEEWIGISVDEASREKESRDKWLTKRFPFLYDKPMRRSEIEAWLRERGWPHLEKSACIFCPYRQTTEYAKIRDDHPEVFEQIVWFDERIRDASAVGMREKQYILRTLEPLKDLPPTEELTRDKEAQINLFENECDGMCGV